MLRNSAVLALVFLAVAGAASAAQFDAPFTVMTQNMDAGTDLSYVVASALQPSVISLPQAVDLTLAEVQASQIEKRARLLATQIAWRRPDLLALQEATIWQAQVAQTTVTYDQLALLRTELARLGAPYDIVAVNTVNDVMLPGSQIASLRFTDRDVLLVRAGARPPALHFSDVHSRIFDAVFSLSGLRAPAGWIEATVHMGNQHFRLVTTHLESAIPGVPESIGIQVAQTQELLHELRNSTVPVILCGDFNSDANNTPGVPDNTPSAGMILSAGYEDTWALAHPRDPGNTWPLFLEDQFDFPPFFKPSVPFERIDLIFSKKLQVLSVNRVLAPGVSLVLSGSDHAGVIATLSF